MEKNINIFDMEKNIRNTLNKLREA